jgi:hypothetical protein
VLGDGVLGEPGEVDVGADGAAGEEQRALAPDERGDGAGVVLDVDDDLELPGGGPVLGEVLDGLEQCRLAAVDGLGGERVAEPRQEVTEPGHAHAQHHHDHGQGGESTPRPHRR